MACGLSLGLRRLLLPGLLTCCQSPVPGFGGLTPHILAGFPWGASPHFPRPCTLLLWGSLPVQPVQGAQTCSPLQSPNFPFSQQPEKKATCSTSPPPSTEVGNGVTFWDVQPQEACWSPDWMLQTGAPCTVDIGGPSLGKTHPGAQPCEGPLGACGAAPARGVGRKPACPMVPPGWRPLSGHTPPASPSVAGLA